MNGYEIRGEKDADWEPTSRDIYPADQEEKDAREVLGKLKTLEKLLLRGWTLSGDLGKVVLKDNLGRVISQEWEILTTVEKAERLGY